MPRKKPISRSRRDFLQLTALSIGALSVNASAAATRQNISLVIDPADPVASAGPVRWAVTELTAALAQQNITLRQFDAIDKSPASDFCLVAGEKAAASLLKQASLTVPKSPESLGFAPVKSHGRNFLLLRGSDARGLMYALLELADRARFSADPYLAIKTQKSEAETPFTETRSIGRSFVSDVEDKPWFNDREMWPAYFSMLATQRINRFSLNFGIGHDFLTNVIDAYFLFAYPFLLSVPGYNVRAVNLPDAERDQNLEMLKYISQQCVDHGIDFQIGIWTHGYQWKDSPKANYTIEGITPENHAEYSRQALTALLRACPAISGVTIRTHGESGVPEGSYGFWATVFDAAKQSGRQVEIDLHTKGLDQKMIDGALATGMPVRLSPKYWAEHMGMPYHQAAIRELEMPRERPQGDFFQLSSGSRSFARYGYADFLREDRQYKVMTRIWSGTHRFLLWGDPVSTAGHARAFNFCGMNGVELYEPLFFKGRRGSGLPGGRCAYADASLNPHWDWEKYLYTYRVWGRLLYNPESDADVWRRPLRQAFQASAPALEAALATASRITPIITSTHCPSAANDAYNVEFCFNQSMLTPADHPFGDTPAPKIFPNVSPLDPQLFSRMSDCAAELLKGERSGKYTPIEVAQWLEDLSDASARQLVKAQFQSGLGGDAFMGKPGPEFRRAALDLQIQIGVGRFFAAKFRAGVLYAVYEQSGDRAALEESLKAYRQAREIWSQFADKTKGVYMDDITYGPNYYQRGCWLDRMAAMDTDLAEMAKRLAAAAPTTSQSAVVHAAIQYCGSHPVGHSTDCRHTPPTGFTPGQSLALTCTLEKSAPVSARLFYRHVNQSELYQSAEAEKRGREFKVTIPAAYAAATYPLQYYFELRTSPAEAWLYPGFAPDLANQPYFVVRPAKS